ncbi:DUF590-domain-containing protein [Cylindrobasidium torrendii FP15055 ss-10]|uniref:DUF590-domain-containing protein n=1 Tax=Cylindrobasidium torrendii FP15055 ss-10 TaxID=1314674 RepID=A0A0D7BQP0_9AGAR|nr:DUF590-domain-containing protein [Cylindrobasidium torrendii FP15055 ss-10]
MVGQSDVDVVITFRASKDATTHVSQGKAAAAAAEEQYTRLMSALSDGGLRAVSRRGDSSGHLLIFVHCPKDLLKMLDRRERHSDFLNGLPRVPTVTAESSAHETTSLPPSDRIRLVHAYISALPSNDGLGILPGSPNWDLVESIMALHDKEFNCQWMEAWTYTKLVSVSETEVRDEFGESVALYFAFLKGYTHATMVPAILGTICYFFGTPYSPLYSFALVVWAICFVEWWRVREQIISLRFGSRGSFRVEKLRPEYVSGSAWWARELRVLASIPVIMAFILALIIVLTSIFVFEAFVTQLYTGVGNKYVEYIPTIVLALFVPKILSLYEGTAERLTQWENHAHYSSHTTSLTLKTFALNSLVEYLPLVLSAFLYVPFGAGIMGIVQSWLFGKTPTDESGFETIKAFKKLDPSRLETQMFAFTVTQQASDAFTEIGMPYILRAWENYRNGKGLPTTLLRAVTVENIEHELSENEEHQFLENVRYEASLPEYNLFFDYSEMVTQFGYVAVWSTIWPIAPLLAYINNVLELKSDAFKIITHQRRPISVKTDSIGPWLDALTFLTWFAAVINASLVYLFRVQTHTLDNQAGLSAIDRVHARLFSMAGAGGMGEDTMSDVVELTKMAAIITFAASQGYALLRVVIRHIMERAIYTESQAVKDMENDRRNMRAGFLKSITRSSTGEASDDEDEHVEGIWSHDEGLQELQCLSKED